MQTEPHTNDDGVYQLVTGLPVDLVRAMATFFFLWLGAEPMLEKLDRIKTKYGLGCI